MTNSKYIDLMVYGATGFTGKLACDYLADKGEAFFESFKWAIAGRDQQKLENLKISLVCKHPYLQALEILIADSFHVDQLNDLTSKSKAVISFVGPYSKYGTQLVKSCVENSTHYADLTGELCWVAEMIKTYDDKAKQNRVKVITSCGFDSVPSDWAAYSVAKLFKEKLNEDTKHVKTVLWAIKGGFSGGTIASGFEMFERENTEKTLAVLRDPQALVPEDKKNGLDKEDESSVSWDSESNAYLAPFIMAPTNCRVVRRSNAFNNYGSQFTYDEYMKCSTWIGAQAFSWMLYIINVVFLSPWLRSFVRPLLPKPGYGPSEAVLKSGFAHFKIFGQSSVTGSKAVGGLKIHGDPGYLVTARMLVEAGIDMANESDKFGGPYGFLTPCSGLSDRYFETLLQNGFEINVQLQ